MLLFKLFRTSTLILYLLCDANFGFISGEPTSTRKPEQKKKSTEETALEKISDEESLIENLIIHEIAIGFMVEEFARDIHGVMEVLANRIYVDITKSIRMKYQLLGLIVKTADAFKLTRLMCQQFSRGIIAFVGTMPPDAYDIFYDYANIFHIPFVTPWLPARFFPHSMRDTFFTLSMRPEYHQAIIDTIVSFGWKEIIYIYDTQDGLLRLQEIFHSKRSLLQIYDAKRIANAEEIMTFLISIERDDPWSNKYVVLDTGAQLAAETLRQHVTQKKLGLRNYHYFLVDLVTDDLQLKPIVKFGAINVTGISIIDRTDKKVQEFISEFGRSLLTTPAALTYDIMQVLNDSVLRTMDEIKDFVTSSELRNISSVNETTDYSILLQDITPYKYGLSLYKNMMEAVLEGTTGHIEFNDKGHRHNFTLHIMQLDTKGSFQKIGTWHDYQGLSLFKEQLPGLRKFNFKERDKTYIVSSIAEYPYLKEESSSDLLDGPREYSGFCADLTKLIMKKLQLKYTIKLVTDGRYGHPQKSAVSGWDGMIGEILQEEADMVVAPLAVNPERQKVVDFSQPFLSFQLIPEKSNESLLDTVFTFLAPLSTGVWICILVSMIVVAICHRIVSKYAPSEQVRAANNRILTIQPYPVNNSLWKSLWFTLCTFFRQGSRLAPRSLSAKIITVFWYFFALIIIVSYTAGLTAYLTINSLNEPLQSYTKVMECPKDEYRSLPQDGEDTDPYLSFVPALFKKEKTPCKLIVSITEPGIKEFAVALPKGSQLRDSVNLALETLRAEGELQRLIRAWFIDTKSVSDNMKGTPMSITQLAAPFGILMAGILIGMLTAYFQTIRRRRSNNEIEAGGTFGNNIPLERIDTVSAPLDADRAEDLEEDDDELFEDYGVPPNWNGRRVSHHYEFDEPSSISRDELAGILAQASPAGPSTFRRPRRLSECYELYNL